MIATSVLRSAPVALLLATASACVGAKIYSAHEVPFPESARASEEEVAALIDFAARRQGWVVQAVATGKMRARYGRGRHSAVVTIRYSTKTFSISYFDSANLRYDGRRIHGVYNKWVKNLEAAIQREAHLRLR